MIVKNYTIDEGKGKKALLINPPVYDFAYSNSYNQPDGLLRIGTLLKKKEYITTLIDFLEKDSSGRLCSESQPKNPRYKGLIRNHYGMSYERFKKKLLSLSFYPDEIYITSTMTYWWESTRDVIKIVKEIFPKSKVLIGGIYPTLCSEHAESFTQADIIVKGEIKEASDLWSDIALYKKIPSYAIINFSRGCPFRCAYCAQRIINGQGMRYRNPDDIVDEIEFKYRLGTKDFLIFSDNFLLGDHFPTVLEKIIQRNLKIALRAPKGMESRLISRELLALMKMVGWKTINMAFESINANLRADTWNRRHNSNTDFETAVQNASEFGFNHEAGGIVGFVLFGAPEENLDDVWETSNYLHNKGIFIRPMPFTPVPGTEIYKKYHSYIQSNGMKLEDLNEKLYPFADLNRVPVKDYVKLHKKMCELNGKLQRKLRIKSFDIEDIIRIEARIPIFQIEKKCSSGLNATNIY